MSEFLTDSSFLLPALGFAKAFFVAMFGLNLGVILTWVERRMRGMIQDSVGPNRAAIPMPGKLAAGLAFGPALLAALAVLFIWFALTQPEATLAERESVGPLFTHLGIFILWLSAAAVSRAAHRRGGDNGVERLLTELGPPRAIVVGGLIVHAVVIAAGVAVSGTQLQYEYIDFLFGGGALLLVFAIVASAGHVAAAAAKQDTVRINLLGLLHPAADGLKTAFKSDFSPQKGDKLLYNLAPWISFFPALIVLAVIPFGPTLCFGTGAEGAIDFTAFQGIEAAGARCTEASFSMMVADLDIGILFFFAMAGTGIVGAAVAGWASDNKYSLLGGMRAASQMVSYEVTLGLTVIGALMIYGTFRIDQMILWQAENAWGIFVQPLGFFLFVAAAIAETKRVPFDIPEGESEIVAGYFTEYAGMKFAMFFFSEFIAVVASSTLMVTVFLGGWHLPFFTADGIVMSLGDEVVFSTQLSTVSLAVIGFLSFIGKVVLLCLLQVCIRWTLPRFRYDQLMRLGWRKLLPASLFNIMLTATIILAVQSGSGQLQAGFAFAGDLTMLLVALTGVLVLVSLFVFLLTPIKKQRMVVSSAARYAEMMGGIRTGKMEA